MPRSAKSLKPTPAASATATAPLALGAPVVLVTSLAATPADSGWAIARQLAGRRVLGHRIVAEQSAQTLEQARRQWRRWLRLHRPALVLCLGPAPAHNGFSLERAALNGGTAPDATPLVPHGPAAYLSGLPLQAMLHGLQQAGLAAEVSPAATSPASNQAFYALMHELARQPARRQAPVARGGLLQVPGLGDEPGVGTALGALVEGVRLALRYALRVSAPLR